MIVEKKILTVGFDKNGEADFAVSLTVCDLTYEEMDKLRAMVTVAIGQMERAWYNEYMQRPENQGKQGAKP